MTDTYYLDYDDIVYQAPGTLMPYGYTELVPGSGVGIPDLSVNTIHPGFWPANQTPKRPIDLADITYVAPGQLAPYGTTELVPGTGVYIPDPHRWNRPMGGDPPPKAPLDLNQLRNVGPNGALPFGYMELFPGTGIGVPDPHRRGPTAATQPASNEQTTEDPAAASPAPAKPFELDYGRVEGLAKGHDISAEQIKTWADADPNFAERFLATHGKVAYATYLNIKNYTESRQAQATAYANRNTSTAQGLRDFSTLISTTDDTNATAFRPPTTTV